MALNIQINQHDVFLKIVVSGTYDLTEAIDRFPHVLAVCRFTGSSKVLIDFSNLSGIPQATQKIIYAFGVQNHYEQYLKTGGDELKIAYLAQSSQVSTYEPGIEIARDQQLPFELFTNRDEALKWLDVK